MLLDPSVIQRTPFHNFAGRFFEMHFYIIFPSMPNYTKLYLSFVAVIQMNLDIILPVMDIVLCLLRLIKFGLILLCDVM